MNRRPPRSTLTDTLFPYTTLCRSDLVLRDAPPENENGALAPQHEVNLVSCLILRSLAKQGVSKDEARHSHCPTRRYSTMPASLAALASVSVMSAMTRSEERRVGKACVSTCRSRW